MVVPQAGSGFQQPGPASTSGGDADPTRRSLRLTRATHGAPSIACTSAGRTRPNERGEPAGVIAIACARELATFCWEAATLD
jgi:hypothetical protein